MTNPKVRFDELWGSLSRLKLSWRADDVLALGTRECLHSLGGWTRLLIDLGKNHPIFSRSQVLSVAARAWSLVRLTRSAGRETHNAPAETAPKIGPGHAAIKLGGIVHFQAEGALQHGKVLDWGPAGVKVVTRGGHYDVAYGDIKGAGVHPDALAAQPEVAAAAAAKAAGPETHQIQVSDAAWRGRRSDPAVDRGAQDRRLRVELDLSVGQWSSVLLWSSPTAAKQHAGRRH